MKSIKRILLAGLMGSVMALTPHVGHASTVYTDELTWEEIQLRQHAGASIIIIPTGGTEQEGPHMITGMHNEVMRYAAGEIAKKLHDALVAPVITYAPAGRIDPAEGHMQFAGTISVSDRTYEAILQDAARSFKQHGFRTICFIGDAMGSQRIQEQVANELTNEWGTDGVKVVNVSDYYYRNGQEEWTDSMGIKVPEPGAHAGLIETSELMSVDAAGVHDNMRGVRTERDYKATGAMGDSSLASANYGRRFLSLKIEAAIKQIQNASNHAK